MILDSWFISIATYVALFFTYNVATFYFSVSDKKIKSIDTTNLNNAQIKKIADLYDLATSCCFVWLVTLYALFNFGRSAKKSTSIKLPNEVRKILVTVAFKRSPIGFLTLWVTTLFVALGRKFFTLMVVLLTSMAMMSAPAIAHNNSTVSQIMEQKIKIGVYRTFSHYKHRFMH